MHDALVVSRDARGAAVEIKVRLVVESADLLVTHLVDDVPVTQREIPAARAVRGFDDLAVVAGAFQLVRNREPGDTRTEDRDLPLRRTERLQVQFRHRAGVGHQAERQAGLVDRAGAAGGADHAQEPPPGDVLSVHSIFCTSSMGVVMGLCTQSPPLVPVQNLVSLRRNRSVNSARTWIEAFRLSTSSELIFA